MEMNHSAMPSSGLKRIRDDDDDEELSGFGQQHQRKHVRPTWSTDGCRPHDSVISTPAGVLSSYEHPKYDSDAPSSVMSELGSPQDLGMSSSDAEIDDDDDDFLDPDDDMADDASFDLLGEMGNTSHGHGSRTWRTRLNSSSRLPTPFSVALKRSSLSSSSSSRIHPQIQQHIRQRHPQEYSSEHRDAPSPINEDHVSARQSTAAADAAGSQLSLLSVSDMEMDAPDRDDTLEPLPRLVVNPSRQSTASAHVAVGEVGSGWVRKQRQRSGAQSSGSASPARSTGQRIDIPSGSLRGVSVGFRADCDKCRMRVPGHMNHFIS